MGRRVGHWAVQRSDEVSDALISSIKEGALLFVYAQNDEWLKESKFLE